MTIFHDALNTLKPNANWVVIGDDTYANITWIDTEQTKPTESAVTTKVNELQTAYDAKDYSRLRKAKYNLLNQDEMRYDDLINSTTTWRDGIAAIKAAHPKPQEKQMAIVINGSGTVSGLAVGGLPDDSVDAGSLANSINSEITANTAKTGISSAQTNAITANTAKTGITSSQATAITAALPKAGGAITGTTTHADNVKTFWGSGNDLEIFHDGTTSIIRETNSAGDFHIQGKEIVMKMDNGENSAIFRENGGVELMHNAAQKFATTATGIDVTGAITVGGVALASGISEADQWRITTDVGASGVTQITANWERADTYGSNKLGTGMTQSSGVFTFPSTGFWRVDYQFRCNSVSVDVRYIFFAIETTTNGGSNWNIMSQGAVNISNFMSGTEYNSSAVFALIDVTSTSNVKVRVRFDPSAYIVVDGHTSSNETGLLFTKLAETQNDLYT